MSDSWICYECDEEHPFAWGFCPATGRERHEASTPTPEGMPRCWVGNEGGWRKLKRELEGLSDEELAAIDKVRESKK